LQVVLLIGVVYIVAGLLFASLAKSAPTNQVRVGWRLAAWLISAIAFAAHIGYEHTGLRSSPRTTALHASLAVALGAFGIAVAASIHGYTTHHPFPAFALVLWPVLTALPAFVVALAAGAVMTRVGRSDSDHH
jgi:peptidoglycan/LPS O-acetylase OafA/YrhL